MWMIHFAGKFWDAIAEEWVCDADAATRMPLKTARMVAPLLGADVIPDQPRKELPTFADATKLTNVSEVWDMWLVWNWHHVKGRSGRWTM